MLRFILTAVVLAEKLFNNNYMRNLLHISVRAFCIFKISRWRIGARRLFLKMKRIEGDVTGY